MPTPIPKPTPTPTPVPAPTPAPAPAPIPITVHLLAVLQSRYDSIADLPDKAKISTIHGQQEPRLETALATYEKSFELLIIPGPELYDALKRPIDAVLVKSHPSYYLQKYIPSSEVLLLPWNSKAVTAVIDAYPETTVLARLPANTYEGQTKSILGYAPAN